MNVVVCSSVFNHAKPDTESEFMELWSGITKMTREYKYAKYYSSDLLCEFFSSSFLSLSWDTQVSIMQYFHLNIDKNYPIMTNLPCVHSQENCELSEFSNWLNCLLEDESVKFECHVDKKKLALGVYTIHDCGDGMSAPCRRCQVLTSLSKTKWLQLNPKHYFLKYYDEKLPVAGDFPFHPPKDWHKKRNHGSRSLGFIDREKNKWIWGVAHGDDHWDVTTRNGTHKNILPSGFEKGHSS